MHALPAFRDQDQGGVRVRERRRRPDVHRRGPRRGGGSSGASVRRPRGRGADGPARRDRVVARGRLDQQRGAMPPAGEPRSAAPRGGVVPALHVWPDPAHRTARDRDTGQLRDPAPDLEPDADQPRSRDAAGAHARRAPGVPDAAVPSRGGAPHPEPVGDASRGLPQAPDLLNEPLPEGAARESATAAAVAGTAVDDGGADQLDLFGG